MIKIPSFSKHFLLLFILIMNVEYKPLNNTVFFVIFHRVVLYSLILNNTYQWLENKILGNICLLVIIRDG